LDGDCRTAREKGLVGSIAATRQQAVHVHRAATVGEGRVIVYVALLYVGFLFFVAAISVTALAWILASNIVLAGSVVVVDRIGRDR